MINRITTKLATIVFVASTVSACNSNTPTSAAPNGPLSSSSLSGWVDKLTVGDRFTNGYGYIRNPSSVDVTITKVEPEITGDTLRFLGAMQLDEHRRWPYFDRSLGWPRSIGKQDELFELGDVPVIGVEDHDEFDARQKAFASANLLLGFEVLGEGKADMTGVTVTYTDGESTWAEFFRFGMTICSPKGKAPCNPSQTDGQAL